jgi:hypothetical protein
VIHRTGRSTCCRFKISFFFGLRGTHKVVKEEEEKEKRKCSVGRAKISFYNKNKLLLLLLLLLLLFPHTHVFTPRARRPFL